MIEEKERTRHEKAKPRLKLRAADGAGWLSTPLQVREGPQTFSGKGQLPGEDDTTDAGLRGGGNRPSPATHEDPAHRGSERGRPCLRPGTPPQHTHQASPGPPPDSKFPARRERQTQGPTPAPASNLWPQFPHLQNRGVDLLASSRGHHELRPARAVRRLAGLLPSGPCQ